MTRCIESSVINRVIAFACAVLLGGCWGETESGADEGEDSDVRMDDPASVDGDTIAPDEVDSGGLDETPAVDEELVGVVWIADIFSEGEAGWGATLAERPTIVFSAEGHIEVNTGCNLGTGDAESSEGELHLGPINYTEEACGEGLQTRAEIVMLEIFREGTLTYAAGDNSLSVSHGDFGVLARREIP